MLMPKLYNKTSKMSSTSDPRVITPSSIPIFILPPTLDKIVSSKPELNDSCDCWSLAGDENEYSEQTRKEKSDSNVKNSFFKMNEKPHKSTSILNQIKTKSINDNFTNENFDYIQKSFHSQLKSSPSRSRNQIEKVFNKNIKNIKKTPSSTSLENIISSNKITAKLFSNKKMQNNSLDNHRKSLDNQNNDGEFNKLSQHRSQNLTSSTNNPLNTTKTLVKTLFRSGFFNNNNNNCNMINDTDEFKNKESYCNLWVLNGDYKSNRQLENSNSNLNSESGFLAKSTSLNNVNYDLDNYLSTNEIKSEKDEEQLQKDYLSNLILKLQTEKELNDLQNSSNKLTVNNCKKDKRSKSETLITLNSLFLMGTAGIDFSGLANLNNLSKIENENNNTDKSENTCSLAKRSNSNSSSRYLTVLTPSNNLNDNFLNVNDKSKHKSKSNTNIKADNSNYTRRFSFRNLFKNRSNTDKLPSKKTSASSTDIKPVNSIQNNENSNLNNQNESSNQSLSNSSSNFKFPPISSMTGSVLKFHSFKSKLNNEKTIENTKNLLNIKNSKALSDPTVNRLFKVEINKISNSYLKLNPNDTKDLRSNSNSNQEEENDYDQIFNDYLNQTETKKNDFSSKVGTAYHNKKKTSTSTTTSTSSKARSYRNIFNFLFKKKSNNQNLSTDYLDDGSLISRHRRSRTLDSTTKSRLKFFLRRKHSFVNDNIEYLNENFKLNIDDEDIEQLNNKSISVSYNNNNKSKDEFNLKSSNGMDIDTEGLNLRTGDFKNQFSLNYLDLFQIEKEFKRKKNHRNNSVNKSNETLYIDASLVRNNRKFSYDSKKSNTVNEPMTNANNHLNISSVSNSINSTSNLKTVNKNQILNAFIDVSFEKLQQNLNGHLISLNIKNFRVEPLIEINFIKSKLTYLTFEIVEPVSSSYQSNDKKKKKLLAKINKIKVKKCKFDHNLKNFSKPIDFDLVNEHFMNVTEEAMNLQMKKIFNKTNTINQNFETSANNENENELKNKPKNNDENNSDKTKKAYLFYLTIEIHSYLPVSRKTLSSTFRKKKKLYKGQCQIHENFINSTQFVKNFILTEV